MKNTALISPKNLTSAKHTISQADMDAGKFTNIALTDGKTPNGRPLHEESTDPDCPSCTGPGTTVLVSQGSVPDMALSKKTDKTKNYHKADEVIEYTITVKNTGCLTLTDIEVTDDNADAPDNR